MQGVRPTGYLLHRVAFSASAIFSNGRQRSGSGKVGHWGYAQEPAGLRAEDRGGMQCRVRQPWEAGRLEGPERVVQQGGARYGLARLLTGSRGIQPGCFDMSGLLLTGSRKSQPGCFDMSGLLPTGSRDIQLGCLETGTWLWGLPCM
jgi:hypothetical protein